MQGSITLISSVDFFPCLKHIPYSVPHMYFICVYIRLEGVTKRNLETKVVIIGSRTICLNHLA